MHSKPDNLSCSLQSLLEREAEAIRNIPLDGSIEQAVDLFYTHVHVGTGKVVVSGVGKAGQIGMKLATTLCSTGTPASFLNALDAQHGDLGLLQEDDVLFLLSNSGQTEPILELISLAQNLEPEISIVVITRNLESDLAELADVVIHTGYTQEICPLGLTPTTSTTVMGVLGDLVVVLLMEKIGFTKEAYAIRHHAGYLGKKARKDE